MAVVIGAILALLAIAVAVFPFVRGRFFSEPASPPTEDGAAESAGEASVEEDELAAIYQAIATLRLERELGNIPEGLYREQLNGYRLQAAVALRKREANLRESASSGRGPEGGTSEAAENWALEEEIKVARSGLYGGSNDASQ